MTSYSWTGKGDGTSWMDGGNWGDPNNTNGTPQSGDDATFSIAATINDSGQADNLYVDADLTLVGMITASFAYVNYTFDIQGMMTTTMSFEVDDYTTTVESGGDLETDNSGTGTAAIVDGGEIDVDGGTFDLTGGAVVGASRYGDLVIENGGTADFTQTSNDYAALGLGDQAGSYGDAEVTGGSTLTTNVGGITIGVNGSGDLDIDGGSEVTVGEDNPSEFSGAGAGKNADSDGSLEVYDGSTFTVTDGGFDDGYDGSGSVDVEGGSTVSIENDTYGNLSIGSQSDGSGDFYISDSGSTLSVAATLIVGDAGEGTLEIENGATVEADSVTVAGEENDDPSSISIDGDGSDLSVDKILTVGDGGTGYLYMTGGATVEAQNLNIAVQETSGDPDSGMQSEVSVEGDNTQLTIDDAIVVGLAGTGSLSISDGGVVEADSLDVANQATSGSTADDTPSTVSVDGNDSTLTIKGEGFIGDGGYGSLTLSDGATASFDSLDVATQDTSGSTSDQMPSSVTVTGNSTELKIEDGLFVGDSGYGVVGITEGASVTADGLDIAFQASSGSAGDSAYSAVNVDGSGSKLTIDGDGFVGDAGLGALTLVDGATASFQTLDIATQESSGSTDDELASYVYLDGDDTSLDVEESIFVGDAGYGRLEIADGATVTGDTIVVAHDDTSGVYGSDHDTSQSGVTGQANGVYIHGEGSSLTLSGTAFVGDAGFGYIDVWDGSEMSAASLDIAVQASSGQTSSHNESFIEVNNANSNLQVSGDAKVGDAGYGALTDFDGATTSIGGDLDIAAQASSGSAEDEASSFVTVQGNGSKMTVTGTTTIGDAGEGLLGIYDGGVFTTGGDTLEIAAQAESTGELQVENADTTFTFSGDVTDGDEGDGTIDIEDGATVTIGGKLFVGTGEDSVSKLDVEGEGSTLTVKGDLILGQDGEADVTIGDGGDLTVDGNVYASNSTVDIEGDPTINGDLNLGIGTPGGVTGGAGLQTTGVAMWTLGGGTTLTVTGTVDMGVAAGDMGTLTVTGANTQFIVRTDLIIGDAGTGTLNVQNGAAATITGAITLGAQATGIGTLTINGNGSTVTAGAQDVTIGDAGTGTLNVQMGGLLDADSVGITLGSQNGAAGTLTVANMDSEVDAGTLTVGDDGMGDATISTGGALSVDGDATLGAQSNGNGQVTVSDAQSSFDVGGGLTLGDAGSGQLLDDGDTSVSGALTLGAQAGSSGQVTVNVGTLDVDGDTAIGKQGAGTLLVQLAGTFTAHDVTLADALGSSGTFTVDGDGTTATTDDLTIGTSGSGMLNVTGGAMLTTSGDATLGDAVSANIDTAKVDTQANWGIDGDLTVGSSGIATLNVTGGGSVTDSGNVVFGDQSAASGEATVSGSITNQDSGDTSASTLNWGQTLTVGNYGYGTLTLAKGALVAPTQGGSGEVDVAAQAGSTGTVSVTDTGSTLDAANLAIGGTLKAAGGTGSLSVSNGALADIGTGVTMWNGTLDVSQGGQAVIGQAEIFRQEQDQVLVATNGLLTGYGTIDGEVDLSGGSIDASGGTLTINGDVSGQGVIDVGSGSTLDITGNVSGSVSINLAAGAKVELGGAFASGTSIHFEDANDGSSLGGQSVVFENPQSIFNDVEAAFAPSDNGTIDGLAPGDQIVLQNISYDGGDPVWAATTGFLNGVQTLQIWEGALLGQSAYGIGWLGPNYALADLSINGPSNAAQLANAFFGVSSSNGGQATTLTLQTGNPIDLSINGPSARQTFGVTGKGVVVGVISNSDEAIAMADVVSSIAPGATVIPVISSGGAYGLADAINNLVAAGANIIVDDLEFFANEVPGGVIDDAIDAGYAKGVTFVSAAGNARPPFHPEFAPPYHVVYGHELDPYELSTAAMNFLSTPSSVGGYFPVATDPYSQMGVIDITGPVGGPTSLPLTDNVSHHDPFFGTSAAAPAVAGVAALMMQEDPALAADPDQLYQEIEDSALPFNDPTDEMGHGLVQADAAVALANADKGNYFTQAANGLNVVGAVISNPSNATAQSTEHIDLTLSEGVTLSGSGTPALVLNDGAQANYDQALSNPANGTLVFDYNVGASDQTPNLAITGFDPNGVTIEDGAGNSADFSGVFNVASGTSVNSPFTATSISTNETGEATSGQTVQLTLTLNEAAHITTAGGDPTLSLSDGATADYDANASNLANGQLVFDYQVGATDADPDLSVVAVNLPTGTTIQDGNGYNADFFPILVEPTGLQIGPTSLQSLIANASGSADTGANVELTLAFSGPVTLDTTQGSPTLTLNDNETATYNPNASDLAGGEIVFDDQVASSDQTADLAATSFNPNGSVLTDENGAAVDLSALTDISTGLSINSLLQATTATPSQTGEADTGTVLKITLAFNEAIDLYAVDESETPTLGLNDGATATFDSEGADGDSLVFDYSVGSADQTSDLAITSVDLNGIELTDAAGYNADFASILDTPLDVAVNEDTQPCYCPGTLIMTDKGDVPVEALTIGDQVLTHAGELRPIKWIGRRSYGSRFVMGRKDILPVRIKAGALGRDASGESLPRRDLWISPHHAMYLDGVLIEAKDLLNGVSIVQTEQVEAEQACEVTYIHIELDSHDVILAEGAWSETFLDENNRGMFHNAGDYQALYPQPQTDLPTHARYYAPRLDGGFAAERIRQNIAAIAGIAAQPEATGPLRGFIDLIDTHSVQGWAQDCDHPDVPVCLAIHEGETLLGHVLAGGYRADLAQAGVGNGHHAFVFRLPARKASASSNIIITRALDGARLAMSETAHAALTGKSRLKPKAHVTPGARRAILRDAHRKRCALHITMSDALKLAWAAFKSQTQTPSAAAATLTERAA